LVAEKGSNSTDMLSSLLLLASGDEPLSPLTPIAVFVSGIASPQWRNLWRCRNPK